MENEPNCTHPDSWSELILSFVRRHQETKKMNMHKASIAYLKELEIAIERASQHLLSNPDPALEMEVAAARDYLDRNK